MISKFRLSSIFLFLMVLFLKKNTIVLQLLESFCVCVSRGTTDAILLLKWKLIPWGDIKSSFGLLHCEEKYCVWRSSADLYDRFIVRRKCSPCSSGPPASCTFSQNRSTTFFRITQYNAYAHNTHAHSPIWIHIHKPCPYVHLRRTKHRQIWRFSKSPQAPRRRRECRLPLNA
jgi:hypothetical protein